MKSQATIFCLLLLFATCALSQQASNGVSTQALVPRLIRFSGQVKDASGSIGVTFSLHKSQDDHSALWIETQSVPLDANGKYQVLLGATEAEGIPMDLFLSGEAQWLAVQVEGKAEQPRVLLVSVPYALKAAEAETLAGHAASEFVTADKLTATVQEQLQTAATPALKTSATTPSGLAAKVVSSGPTNFSGTTTDQIVNVTQLSATGAGLNATAPAIAIRGASTATSGTPSGVLGSAAAPGGAGVYGSNNATSGASSGVYGSAASPGGVGVYGNNTAASGNAVGVKGTSASTSGIGVLGQGLTGIEAISNGSGGSGILATATSNASTAGVFLNSGGGKVISGQSGAAQTEVFSVGPDGLITAGGLKSGAINADTSAITNGYVAIQGNAISIGVIGKGDVHGVEGTGTNIGVYGNAAGGVQGIGPFYGVNGHSTGSGPGVYADGPIGVNGFSAAAYGEGVLGQSQGANGAGVSGTSSSGEGLYGYDAAAGYGLLAGVADLVHGYAGWFNGNVEVDGTLTKAAGYFKIDDPHDPANKYHYHSFDESPDMMNMYNGNIMTDAAGDAVVKLPDWFEALNRDFRYQLTVMGQFAQAIVAKGVENGGFAIKTNKPNVMVSWQVTGIRQDAFANAHRIPIEVEKPA
jgi:trimeric autotransporter adhesin